MTSSVNELRSRVSEVVGAAPVFDMHTHLFAPEFGGLNLSGIDELLTYHYLVAETFRSARVGYEQFWELSKPEQADLVWRTLFVENTPVSEAARAFFRGREPAEHLSRVLELAGVSDVVMTNDPFDGQEARVWESGVLVDRRFHAALRMDGLLNEWERTASLLEGRGYEVDRGLFGKTAGEVRRFLDVWVERMRPLYMA